jgi:hypothetical protein
MKRVLIAAGVLGAVALGAVGVASAQSSFVAPQSGFRQVGNARIATLKITVEGAIADPSAILLPDSPYCPAVGNCGGGALSFDITNPTDVPVWVTDVAVVTTPCFVQGCTPAPVILAPATQALCGQHATFTPPPHSVYQTLPNLPLPLVKWPIVSPHGTLHVNGSDYGGLGAHMIHLDSSTPDECQGEALTVALVVTARDAS